MKDSYERTILNITEFQQEDVIVTSTVDPLEPDNVPKGKFMAPIR